MSLTARRRPKVIVLTGGPGAGKTAALEVIRRDFCEHVAVLPEAAGVVFGGGFPRGSSECGRRAAQRAIYRIQQELERLALDEARASVILCDRGTLDGLAYWPADEADYFRELDTSFEKELARYDLVIHLRTPSVENGYNHENPLRIETALEAASIDERIARVWCRHPRVVTVFSHAQFIDKLHEVVDLVRRELPETCCSHPDLAQPATRSVGPSTGFAGE